MDGNSLPRLEWGEQGPLLHLAHANGFPPGTYSLLAERLATRTRVLAMHGRPFRPGADPAALGGWGDLATDLAEALRRRLPGTVAQAAPTDTRWIGVGHSLGGVVSAYAAAAHPGLFSALVLLDPTVFCGARALLWGLLQRLGQQRRVPIVAGALRRRERFASRAEAGRVLAAKSPFSRWEPRCLADYLAHGLVDLPDGQVTLAYPRGWEARLLATAPHDPWPVLGRLDPSLPLLVLRGESSDTFLPGAVARLRRLLPWAEVEEVAGTGHLLPMERPGEVAARILGFLDRRGVTCSGPRLAALLPEGGDAARSGRRTRSDAVKT